MLGSSGSPSETVDMAMDRDMEDSRLDVHSVQTQKQQLRFLLLPSFDLITILDHIKTFFF